MTKKKNNRPKHQKDVADTSEEELNETPFQGRICPHVTKAVNLGRVKKCIKTGDLSSCSGCINPPPEDLEIWLCLQCGYRGCGRTSPDKHGLQHFKTIHSDCHSLVLSLLSGDVWCYDCDDGVQLQQSKNLKQCVEFILKLRTNNSKTVPEKSDKNNIVQEEGISDMKGQSTSNINSIEKVSPKVDVKSDFKSKKSASFVSSVKGLRNLGNTCYFNAVMQNLSQTHLLHSILEEICAPEYIWEVPRLSIVKDTAVEDSSAETIKITLPKEFQLVHSFLMFFTRMSGVSQNKNEVINPDDLFKNLQKKAPQFQNYLQQDSHELLRQFLDAIRQEEMKRHKKAILKHFNINSTGLENINDETKKLIKAYGHFANHTVVDKIFGGLLISTVLCEECKMSSQVFEPFMDMSLPLFEEKHESNDRLLLDGGKQDKNKPLRNRKSDADADENDEYVLNKSKKDYSKPSKHQEKKMKQLEKKEKKKIRKTMKKDSLEAFKRDAVPSVNGDATKTAEDDSPVDGSEPSVGARAQSPAGTSPEKLVINLTATSGAEDTVVNGNDTGEESGCPDKEQEEDDVALVLFGEEVAESDEESEKNPEEDFPFADEGERDDEEGEGVRSDSPSGPPLSGLDERMHALGLQVRELRIRRDSDRQDNGLLSGSSADESGSADEEGMSHNLSEGQLKEWVVKSLATLKPRKPVAPLECSVDSCLAHFTKPELLTGNNKFRCESCSDIKRKKTGDKKTVVYSNASKQLLVFSPPAILTLHLKRFQQVSMSLRKVNRFVEFPMTLDLAPYCSSACSILPHVSSAGDEILYSLYGIVEHSGHLRSGHYTAFVKLRRRSLNRSFLCQLPIGQCDLEQLLRKFSKTSGPEAPPGGTDGTDDGQWFYVSDGHVRDATEAQVLKCQAYLLFYERIR